MGRQKGCSSRTAIFERFGVLSLVDDGIMTMIGAGSSLSSVRIDKKMRSKKFQHQRIVKIIQNIINT